LPERIEECLYRLDRGEDLLDVLVDYPDQQQSLKSKLLVAMASRAFPVPNPDLTARRLGKNIMLQEMDTLKAQGQLRNKPDIPTSTKVIGMVSGLLRSAGYGQFVLSYRLAAVALMLVISGGFITISASASIHLGDPFYNIKRGIIRVRQVIGVSYPVSDVPDMVGMEVLPGPGTDKHLDFGIGSNSTYSRFWDQAGIDSAQDTSTEVNDDQVLSGLSPAPDEGGGDGKAFSMTNQDNVVTQFSETDDIPGKALGHGKDNPGKGKQDLGGSESFDEEGNPGKALGRDQENPGKGKQDTGGSKSSDEEGTPGKALGREKDNPGQDAGKEKYK
jgi:hypothetical protein